MNRTKKILAAVGVTSVALLGAVGTQTQSGTAGLEPCGTAIARQREPDPPPPPPRPRGGFEGWFVMRKMPPDPPMPKPKPKRSDAMRLV